LQKTISCEGALSGKGLHTGQTSQVFFKPAPACTGVKFFHQGEPLDILPRPGAGQTFDSEQGARCTVVGLGKHQVKTIEHLFAALSGLGISNIEIHADGPEIPGLDGSALPWVTLFKSLGIRSQDVPREVYRIREPLFCYEANKAIAIYPSKEFRIAYVLDYPHPDLRGQKADFVVTPEIFETEIAPARTFCMGDEALVLKKHGFGLGADYQNTLVFGEKGLIQNRLRFKDECARHKVLDILGDLSLLGFSLVGRVVGVRSGHRLNAKLAEAISAQRKN